MLRPVIRGQARLQAGCCLKQTAACTRQAVPPREFSAVLVSSSSSSSSIESQLSWT
jgi:hypothetical protein